MSINKNRRFRFTSGDFEVNTINEDIHSTFEMPSEKSIKDFSITRKPQENNVKMPPEQQQKLRAMAMQAKDNGGASVGSDAEYLSKVPAHQHNQITMACAGDKVKELKKTMNEEIMKTSEDEATTDILTETANDNIIYKNYDMADLDTYISNVDSLSMLEAISLKNSVLKEVNRLESCHTMVKAVDDLRENFDFVQPGKEPTLMDRKNAGTNADKAVLTANYLDSFGYKESAEEFAKIYEDYKPKLDELVEKLDKRIEDCTPMAASTTYMTNDFLKIINKRINNLKEDDINYKTLSKSLDTLKTAFENRTDIEYLATKFDTYVKNKNHLKDIKRAINGTFSDVSSKMNKNFATKTMHSLIATLDKIYFGNRYKVLSFIQFLNYICANEASSNADAWVKVLVLNISDINKNIWDIDGVNSNDYLEWIYNRFNSNLTQVEIYLTNTKTKISSSVNAQYDALLNWTEPEPEKKAEDAVTEETTEVIPESEDDGIEHIDAEVVDYTPKTELHERKEIIEADFNPID